MQKAGRSLRYYGASGLLRRCVMEFRSRMTAARRARRVETEAGPEVSLG
jgi:hypothetical protein